MKILTSKYRFVRIEGRTHYEHRVLAEKHIPNPEGLPCINHKDGNGLNNSLDNLEWCTQADNIKHAHRSGLNKGSDKPVTNGYNYYGSARQAALATEINQSNIGQAAKGNRQTAGGFEWRYAPSRF